MRLSWLSCAVCRMGENTSIAGLNLHWSGKRVSSSTQVNVVCLTFEHKFRLDKRPWKHDEFQAVYMRLNSYDTIEDAKNDLK